MQLTNSRLTEMDCGHELPPGTSRPSVLGMLACKIWPFDYVEKRRVRYGDRFTLQPIGMPPLVFLSSPRDIRAIATAPPDVLHAGGGGALMAPVFGEHAFMLRNRDEHASVREAITPMFHNRMIQVYIDTTTEVVDREVSSWPVDGAVSLSPYLDRLTLKAMLGIAIASHGREHGGHEVLCQRMLDMLSVMTTLLLHEPRLRHLPGWRGTWRRFIAHRQAVDELVYGLIERRRGRGLADSNGSNDPQSDNNPQGENDRQGDLLDLLIAARNPDGSPLSDKQVRDNLVSTIVAGQETTAATLGWTLQLLAHNPAVQDRLIEELEGGVGDDYMNAVIQEVLRHRPAFLFLPPRVVLQPTEIGGWDYRPPAQLLACTDLLHHDPELYSDPHAFLPERFLEGPPQPGTLLPWGLGRKRCPGRQIALIEIREVLRRVLSTSLVLPASRRIAHPRWRTALLTPNPQSKLILCSRRSLRPGVARAMRDSI
jgi:cytochrome P450